jgi:hypothetical protein
MVDVDKVIIPQENCEAALKVMQSAQELSEQAIKWIKTAPTASERCNQCACEGYVAGYKAAAPQWISVKNRMPKHDQQVLYRIEIKTKNGIGYKLDYGEYDLERQVFYGEYFDYVDEGWSITHWMPLPEPPKEEK